MAAEATRARAWVLNLDAEQELDAGPRYAPTAQLRRIVARHRSRLIGELVRPGDVIVTGGAGDVCARGLVGVAWSPTPTALRALRDAGADPLDAPDVATLRRVNARPFAVDVRSPLARASFAKHLAPNLDQALELLADRAAAPHGWLVRRSFGAAGRGRRRIAAGSLDPTDRAWLVASLRRGPLVLEPWVEVTMEYTRSGYVRRDGSVHIARPCFQQTTAAGAWTRTEAAARGEVARGDDADLEAAAAAAGEALAAAGYFGPFGIDAFRHRALGAGGARDVLNPLSEINARYTMDWATGMTSRPDRA